MPYKPNTGTPAFQAKQEVKKNGSTMAAKELGQPIPALGQDVVMDMDDGSGAIGGAAGKKFFPKKIWRSPKNEAGVGRCPQKANEFPIEKNFDTKKSVDGSE